MAEEALAGRAVLVTGGASGIGLATVELAARRGARVALNHLPDDPAGPREAARLRGEGCDVTPVAGDVADPDSAPAMVRAAIEALGGRLDHLVNNAGTSATPVPIALTTATVPARYARMRPGTPSSESGRNSSGSMKSSSRRR